jgi:hypothetical protein
MILVNNELECERGRGGMWGVVSWHLEGVSKTSVSWD